MSRWFIVGVPENRRIGMFQEALAAEGEPTATVLSWLDLARGSAEAIFATLPEEPAFVRIDSFGESCVVEQELLRRGFDPDASAWTATPACIARLFDKRAFAVSFSALGIPVPRALRSCTRRHRGAPRWRSTRGSS